MTATQIACGYCGGRGRVPNNPYDREGRWRGPSEHACEVCGGTGRVERSRAAERLEPCRQYPTAPTASGHLERP